MHNRAWTEPKVNSEVIVFPLAEVLVLYRTEKCGIEAFITSASNINTQSGKRTDFIYIYYIYISALDVNKCNAGIVL
jgi:hypothetical protein